MTTMTPPLLPLTEKQAKIIRFIDDWRLAHCDACPTMGVIAKEFGVSKVTIHGYVAGLRYKGYIVNDERFKHKAGNSVPTEAAKVKMAQHRLECGESS